MSEGVRGSVLIMLVGLVGRDEVAGVVVADRPSCSHGRAAGEQEGERRKMTSGTAALVSECERAVLLGHARLLGRASAQRGRARVRMRARGWAEPKERRRSRPEMNFVFLSKKCE
jgi:hypothetical protein